MKSRGGFILLLVVTVLIGSAAVLSVASIGVRLNAKEAGTSADLAQMRAAGSAALAQAVLGLGDEPPLYADGRFYHFSLNGVQMDYQILDRRGLVDLNGANAALLASLFMHLGQSTPDAEALGAAIVDWRDVDDEPSDELSGRGAEKRAYRNAGLMGPGNRPFVDVAEVRGVLGMDAALYAAASPYMSTGSGRKKPLARYAPPLVLDLLDINPSERRDILDSRRNGEPPPKEAGGKSEVSTAPQNNAASKPEERGGAKTASQTNGRYVMMLQTQMQNGAKLAQRFDFSTGPRPGDYAILSRRPLSFDQAAQVYSPETEHVTF